MNGFNIIDVVHGKLTYEYLIEGFLSAWYIRIFYMRNDERKLYTSRIISQNNIDNEQVTEILKELIDYINSKNGICIDGKFYDISEMSLEEYMNFCKRNIQYDNKQ